MTATPQAAPGRRAIVVGAGVGGLAAAIWLRQAGLEVTLLERADTVGGKLRQIEVGGHKILAGPSVLTMRAVFDELMGGRLADHLELLELDPLCRHFFPDGSRLDLYGDEERSARAITDFAGPTEAAGYRSFRRHAARIYDVVRGPFMEQPVPAMWEFLNPRSLWQMTQIDGLRTMWKAIEEHFRDPRLRQLFGRYATYNGSSPFHAPATLSVIAHVENAFGIFAVKGGIHRLAEVLEVRARQLGVAIQLGADVSEILTEGDRATGVRVGGGTLRADLVVANCDTGQLFEQLLRGAAGARKAAERYAAEELSLSAYLLLAVCDRAPLDLAHHNVFFSRDYPHEFRELVDQRRAPADPTVYLCAEDRLEPGPADLDRAFFLTNAPPLDAKGARVDWDAETARCRARVLEALGRAGWTPRFRAEHEVTPRDFAARFPGSRGAIYGLASNSRASAFKRPPNQVTGWRGLYQVGGSAHPGAGLPMVVLSARIATRLAIEAVSR